MARPRKQTIDYFSTTRKTLKKKEREEVFLRDKGKCCDCGKECAGGWVYHKNGRFKTFELNGTHEIHHIIPIEHGGKCIIRNLILLCIDCHRKRHRQHEG